LSGSNNKHTHTHTHQLTMLLSITTNASPPFAAPIFQQQQRPWHTFFFSTGVGTAVLRVPFLGACNTKNTNTSFLSVSKASIHCRRRKKEFELKQSKHCSRCKTPYHGHKS
jgi:hypothetical protein